MAPRASIQFFNHDLVGFFKSIPQNAIVDTVRLLISEFLQSNTEILTVDLYRKITPIHSGSSKLSLKANMIKINATHLVDIIQFSFDACSFTAIGEVLQRTCGTSVGNQISPILSTCAIVSPQRSRGSNYVDNISRHISWPSYGCADTLTAEPFL